MVIVIGLRGKYRKAKYEISEQNKDVGFYCRLHSVHIGDSVGSQDRGNSKSPL